MIKDPNKLCSYCDRLDSFSYIMSDNDDYIMQVTCKEYSSKGVFNAKPKSSECVGFFSNFKILPMHTQSRPKDSIEDDKMMFMINTPQRKNNIFELIEITDIPQEKADSFESNDFEMIQCYNCIYQNGYAFTFPIEGKGFMAVHCDKIKFDVYVPLDEYQNCLDFIDSIIYTDIENHVEFPESDFKL